jgi:hypothetical protein
VRFHYLPESKRYPETDYKYRTVLDQYNAVLSAVAPTGSQVVLLTTEFVRTARPQAASSSAHPWRSTHTHEAWWHIYRAEMKWEPGACDALFRKVARDFAPNNVRIVAPDCGWLFHPYDGGMDVILDSPVARDTLRSRFSDWLSPLSSGL